MAKLIFEKLKQKEKTIFGAYLYYFYAKQNGFEYYYETDFGFGKLCKGSMRTPDGYWMSFNTQNEHNRFLQTPQLMELWFQSHANGVAAKHET